MKKVIKFLCTALSIVCLISLIIYLIYTNYERNYDALLYINGKEITNENVIIHHRIDHSSYAELPFIIVLENLGFGVEWSNQNVSHISYNDVEYVLNMQDITLFKENDDGQDLISPVPGGNRIYKTLDKELILDDTTIKSALSFMGEKVNIDFDKNMCMVNITNTDTDETSDYSSATETSVSETAEIAVTKPADVNNFFAENDICVKLQNNGTPNSAVTHSSPAYAYDDNFYISIWHNNKFYRYDKNGNKDFITDGVWNCFVKEDTMYCEDWGGATHSKSSLAILSGNEKNIIVEDCHFVYGKSAVYFKYSGEDELYSLAYDTQEIKPIALIPSELRFNAEYKGKLWFKGSDGLYNSKLDGSDIKLIIPNCEKVMGYRNNYIYFMRNSNLQRYSIDENETKSFSIPLNEIHALNFTDSECLIADKNGLFAYNSNFSQSRKLLDIKSIRCISIIDDIIIVGYSDENNNEIYINIDNYGNILHKFEE